MTLENEAKASMPAPHLTEAYHKARRNLALASGTLLAWEYVGLQVGKSTAELPVAKTPVNLLNPEVLPQVIFLIVLYFAVRLWIEWFQCVPKRRENLPSKIDLGLVSMLALFAISLFIFQSFSEIRAADYIPPLTLLQFVLGNVVTLAAVTFSIKYGESAYKPLDLYGKTNIDEFRNDTIKNYKRAITMAMPLCGLIGLIGFIIVLSFADATSAFAWFVGAFNTCLATIILCCFRILMPETVMRSRRPDLFEDT